ncbi:MAG: radical SAM protein [Chloroflexota bacterium]|nr:radical SAM protein [Chloroflexota bacterium]
MPIVEFVTPTGRRLLINARREATSILVNSSLALNYDREGRLTGAWIEGRNYRRSLDNRVIEKQEGPQPGLSYRVRRELEPKVAREFLARMYAMVVDYRAALADPATKPVAAPSPADCAAARDALDRVLECSPERLERDRETFNLIYKPINILPPDQYLAVVLQATEGCSYNHCTFCGFYRDRSFRIKTLDEFRQHIRDVRSFFGGAISNRKSIFLADANALIIPQQQLIPIFDAINAEFALHPHGLNHDALKAWEAQRPIHFDGIYSFIDAFTTRRKDARDFAELAARGLRRVYIGLESGDAELLNFLGKPNTPDDVQQLACHVKAGGVAVGLVILAGAGGERYAEQHVRHTAEIVNAMPLDENDLVYFSELIDYPGSEYSARAREAGISPLSIEQIEQQMARMRAAFQFARKESSPKVSYYDIREFIY